MLNVENKGHLTSREVSAWDAGQYASNTGLPVLYGTAGNSSVITKISTIKSEEKFKMRNEVHLLLC